MHPINNRNFGNVSGKIKISYNAGTGAMDGYIVKQNGTSRYVVAPLANGTTQSTVVLASDTASATTLQPGYATITVTPYGANTVEHVSALRGQTLVTTEGNTYGWTLANAASTGSATLNRI